MRRVARWQQARAFAGLGYVFHEFGPSGVMPRQLGCCPEMMGGIEPQCTGRASSPYDALQPVTTTTDSYVRDSAHRALPCARLRSVQAFAVLPPPRPLPVPSHARAPWRQPRHAAAFPAWLLLWPADWLGGRPRPPHLSAAWPAVDRVPLYEHALRHRCAPESLAPCIFSCGWKMSCFICVLKWPARPEYPMEADLWAGKAPAADVDGDFHIAASR